MWSVDGHNLIMAEGDYGIKLPIIITGATFTANDSVKLTIKTMANGTVIVAKSFTDITNNTVSLEFTEAESAKLKVGTYFYCLDWYQEGTFLCNIIPSAMLKVVDKV